jgi:hypothetical protein
MFEAPDFEFGFGTGRYLRGRGWRGLIALTLLLSFLLLLVLTERSVFASGKDWFTHMAASYDPS